MKCYILYNPMSAGNSGTQKVKELEARLNEKETVHKNITEINDLYEYITSLEEDDKVIVAGGDGTLNTLVNHIKGREVKNELLYYPIGSGNDFAADIGEQAEKNVIPLKDYIKDLPYVEFENEKWFFLNCAGNGFDGYCCGEGARKRKKENKPVNYTAIAIKGLLYDYKPSAARVTVDGVTHTYKKVWLAPVMNGKFFGGGMKMAPSQDRHNKGKKMTVVVVHDCTRIQMLPIFPSIFGGKHVKHKKLIDQFTGNDITVEYDQPTTIQIDGEVSLSVKKCRCVSAK